MNDYPISQLRLVKVHFHHNGEKTPHPTTHMCHESQVDTLVKATINLHHVVGNPHTGIPLTNLWEIEVFRLHVKTKSYWWCVEDLHGNDNPKGAQLNEPDHSIPTRVWAHPDLLAAEKRYEEMEMRED